jgi:hypothetical protein
MGLEGLSQLANVAMASAAVLALVLGIWQVNRSRLSQERATSYEIYTQFLCRTLDHPEFVEVSLTDDEIRSQKIGGSHEEFARYEVYIDLMIVTFEVACTRFRRHRVRCFNGTGGWSWRDGSLRESSSLKRCA